MVAFPQQIAEQLTAVDANGNSVTVGINSTTGNAEIDFYDSNQALKFQLAVNPSTGNAAINGLSHVSTINGDSVYPTLAMQQTGVTPSILLGWVKAGTGAQDGGYFQALDSQCVIAAGAAPSNITKLTVDAVLGQFTLSGGPMVLDTQWFDAALVNGFTVSNTANKPQYRAMPDGTIALRGEMRAPANVANGTVAFNMGTAYGHRLYSEFIVSMNGNNNFQKIIVDSAGNVKIGVGYTGTQIVYLDCVRYWQGA